MKYQKKLFLIFVLVCAFLTQLANPAPARADDGQPPAQPSDAVTELPIQPDDGETPDTPLPDSNPPAESSAPAVDSAPAADSNPPTDSSIPAVDFAPDEADPAPAETTIAETIAQLPEDTGVVVLNENGEALPLASTEAAATILATDPVYCEDGYDPGSIDADLHCTDSYSTMKDLTDVGLIAFNGGAGLAHGGTFFFTAGNYIPRVDETWSGFLHWAPTDLGYTATENVTFQGGWNGNGNYGGLSGMFGLGGQTVFDLPVLFHWWESDVTVNNITVTGIPGAAFGSALSFYGNTGDVFLNNVEVTGNVVDAGVNASGQGAYIQANNVTINNSEFSNNQCISHPGECTGLNIEANGNVVLNGVGAMDNAGSGLYIQSGSDITLNDVNTSYNLGWGARLYATGNVVTGGSNGFSFNQGGTGLHVSAGGDIILNDIYASYNAGDGATLFATGNVILTGTNIFTDNYGVDVYGDGLYVYSGGAINLNNVISTGNSNDGAELYATSDMILDGTNVFNSNAETGLYIDSGGAIFLNDVDASGNYGWGGAELYATSDVILTGINTFNGNWGDGLVVMSNDGLVILENVTAQSNIWSGVTLFSFGNSDAYIIADSIQANGWYDVDASWFCGNTVSLFGYYDFYNPQDCFEEERPVAVVDSPVEQVVNTDTGFEVAFDIDCTIKDVYSIKLPNRDKIKIVCPADGHAVIKRLDNTMLPSDLPAGYTYISAFSLEISLPLVGYISSIEGGHVTVAFSLPIVKPGISYAILYWDLNLGQWQEVQTFMFDASGKPRVFELDPDRNILSGMNFVTNDNLPQMEASLNFPGVFVLAEY